MVWPLVIRRSVFMVISSFLDRSLTSYYLSLAILTFVSLSLQRLSFNPHFSKLDNMKIVLDKCIWLTSSVNLFLLLAVKRPSNLTMKEPVRDVYKRSVYDCKPLGKKWDYQLKPTPLVSDQVFLPLVSIVLP